MRAVPLAALIAVASIGWVEDAAAQDMSVAGGVAAGVGTLTGVASGIAAIVYGLQGRAFTSPWIVVSLFSSAICGATSVWFAQQGGDFAGGATAIWAVVAVWPVAFISYGALVGAAPGDPLDEQSPREWPPDDVSEPRIGGGAWDETEAALIVPIVGYRF